MLRGEIGLKTIMGLLIGLLVLGVVATSITSGPIGDAITQGLTQTEDYTDFTTEIDASNEDEAKETFSDLAMFVRDRAVGCEEVEDRINGVPIGDDDPRPNADEEGYPGLEDTRLGTEPVCVGGSASVIRDQLAWLPTRGWFGGGPEDNYMPGSLSREYFEVTGDEGESIYFQDRRDFNQESEDDYNENRYFLENNIAGVSSQPWENHIYTENIEINAPIDVQQDYYKGSGRNFVVFFEDPEVGSNRTNELIEDWDNADYEDRVWRNSYSANPLEEDNPLWQSGDDDYIRYHPTDVSLCPGDKGFIQMNRGTPMNTGLSDETGAENYYPLIVIEESEVESCEEDLGLGRGGMIPDDTRTSGRMLHITSDTTQNHPYVENLGWTGRLGHFGFGLHEFNEDRDEISESVGGTDIQFNYNSERSDKCIIGVYDHVGGATYDSTGWISFERGAHIQQDSGLLSRSSGFVRSDELDHQEERSTPGQEPRSARDLYDRNVDPGFNRESWEDTDIDNSLLYYFGGDSSYELYSDLLCVPHENNEDFESDHSMWKACENDETIEYGDYSWTCDPESGEWEGGIECGPNEQVCNEGTANEYCLEEGQQCLL